MGSTAESGLNPFATENSGNPNYYEGWAFVKDKSKAQAGVFLGMGIPINVNTKFEVTLRNVGITHFDYTPFTYCHPYQRSRGDHSESQPWARRR